MKCLFGHRYTIQQIGVTSVKYCPRCGKSYILMERYDRITGKSKEDYWKEMAQSKKTLHSR